MTDKKYGYEKKETKPTIYVGVVLDESGSMGTVRASTISGFNEYMKGLTADKDTNYLVSVLKFEGPNTTLLFKNSKPSSTLLNEYNYKPAGGTPLYDAIGKMVRTMEETVPADGSVFFVTLTDGEENASREFKLEGIKTLLGQKQETDKWTMVYLGANQDAWSVGNSMGFNSNFTFDTNKIYTTIGAVREVTTLYASSGGIGSGMNMGSAALNSTFNDAYNGSAEQTPLVAEKPKKVKLTKGKK